MKPIIILGIESSCDDTSASIVQDGVMLSNVTANQSIHASYGGVVPELASRAHQQNIIPVVHQALKQANIRKQDLSAIAFTRGPGLLGSLLVGASFAKGLAQALRIPLLDVNHLQAHVLAHFISQGQDNERMPTYPFLCLLVSGGNSQIVLAKGYDDMQVIGQTIDDAAGEAFDKCAKVMGLPYPGGPHIDRLARQGNPTAFVLNKPQIPDFNYSFSGLKTSFLYLIRDKSVHNPSFVHDNMPDLCASLQYTIIEILMNKVRKAAKELNINQVAVAGGVSANSGLRNALQEHAARYGWMVYIPAFEFTTDNAAMIAITGYLKYQHNDFCSLDTVPFSRVTNKF
jgi:N6-L-threonylcarbamoyladenine synthase